MAIVICFLMNGLTWATVKGWRQEAQEGKRIYQPVEMAQNKVFRVVVSGPIDLNGKSLQEWFLGAVEVEQRRLGEPNEPWVVKPEQGGDLGVANSYHTVEGTMMRVGYQGGVLKDGSGYVLQMVSSDDLQMLLKYGVDIQRILDDAKLAMSAKPSTGSANDAPLTDISGEALKELIGN